MKKWACKFCCINIISHVLVFYWEWFQKYGYQLSAAWDPVLAKLWQQYKQNPGTTTYVRYAPHWQTMGYKGSVQNSGLTSLICFCNIYMLSFSQSTWAIQHSFQTHNQYQISFHQVKKSKLFTILSVSII